MKEDMNSELPNMFSAVCTTVSSVQTKNPKQKSHNALQQIE